ncbi:TonB family protein [Duganella sp. FT27W]|uniref:TonB family protein n=1 Tax=Duganella sp. FT27W TaxID=2654636 RepID=UPI00186B5EFF|nr:TonB family protein [Duganella sp. FT27W]
MSSATLSLRDRYPAQAAPVAQADAVVVTPAANDSFVTSYPVLGDGGARAWWRRPGAIVSIVLHGVAAVAIWNFSSTVIKAPPPPLVVQLIHLPPPKEITLPKPEPLQQKTLAPPLPVVQPVPVPKIAPVPLETFTPPAPVPVAAVTTPAPVAPAPVAPPAPPAPVAPAAPRQISTEGIPTDYVNQVYARINSSTDYPREAKMRRQQGKVGYRLTLSPQGALLSFDIDSSGIPALDEAAREAIRRAAPFPKLPDLGGASYLLAGNIVFKIN